MRAVLAEGERAGFQFANKKECRAFIKEMQLRLKKVPRKTENFSIIFDVDGVELIKKPPK